MKDRKLIKILSKCDIEQQIKLLTMVGRSFEEKNQHYLAFLMEEMELKETLSSRLKFMIMDLVDLRKAYWVSKNSTPQSHINVQPISKPNVPNPGTLGRDLGSMFQPAKVFKFVGYLLAPLMGNGYVTINDMGSIINIAYERALGYNEGASIYFDPSQNSDLHPGDHNNLQTGIDW